MTEARYLVPPTEADEDDIRIGWENGNDRVYNKILERIQEIKQFTDDDKAMYKIQDGFDEEFQKLEMKQRWIRNSILAMIIKIVPCAANALPDYTINNLTFK